MTATESLLRLLSDGKPRTLADLRAESGLTPELVSNAMRNMRKRSYMMQAEPRYVLTAAGAHLLEREAVAKARAESIARQKVLAAQQRAARRQAAEARRQNLIRSTKSAARARAMATMAANENQRIVDGALAGRIPNSVFALGAMGQ